MVEAVKGSLRQYLHGLKDSLYGFVYVFHLHKKIAEQNRRRRQRMQEDYQTRRHRSRFQTRRPLHANAIGTSRPGPPMSLSSKPESGLLQSMASNTVMNCAFWTGLWMFYRFFVPLVTTQIIKPAVPSNLDEENLKWWDRILSIVQFIFSSLWVLPLYIISKILNGLYFNNVSNMVFQYYRGKPRGFSSTRQMILDFMFSLIVEIIFLVQATLLTHVPYFHQITTALHFIHHCLLYALYAFEYKWFNTGLDFRLRVHLIETHWPYFFGFGTPLFLLLHYMPSYIYSWLVSACLFSIFFPFFIISATKAETPAETPAFRMAVFDISMAICDAIFKLFAKFKKTNASNRGVPPSPAPR